MTQPCNRSRCLHPVRVGHVDAIRCKDPKIHPAVTHSIGLRVRYVTDRWRCSGGCNECKRHGEMRPIDEPERRFVCACVCIYANGVSVSGRFWRGPVVDSCHFVTHLTLHACSLVYAYLTPAAFQLHSSQTRAGDVTGTPPFCQRGSQGMNTSLLLVGYLCTEHCDVDKSLMMVVKNNCHSTILYT